MTKLEKAELQSTTTDLFVVSYECDIWSGKNKRKSGLNIFKNGKLIEKVDHYYYELKYNDKNSEFVLPIKDIRKRLLKK